MSKKSTQLIKTRTNKKNTYMSPKITKDHLPVLKIATDY